MRLVILSVICYNAVYEQQTNVKAGQTMGIIKTDKLVFEYIRRDEEGNVEGITRAVDEVDLDVAQGDFVAVLGHNGSGKSTLAKHINAILYPSEGTVWVDGMDTTEEKNLWEQIPYRHE